jgi:RNA-directed DNA polymerase
VRYCDDLVILCRTEAQAREAHRQLEAILERLGLHLNPRKTRLVQLSEGREGFDFLGFHHHKQVSWRWPGRWHLQSWPSQKAMQTIRHRVKEVLTPGYWGTPIAILVARLTPVLRGWSAYFRQGNSAHAFEQINRYVHERLALFASKQHRQVGRGWKTRYPTSWLRDLGVFRLRGTCGGSELHAT